jgi:hypothetical protein
MNTPLDFLAKNWALFFRFFLYGIIFFSVCMWFIRDWSDYEQHVELWLLLLRVGKIILLGGAFSCLSCISVKILFNFYFKDIVTRYGK